VTWRVLVEIGRVVRESAVRRLGVPLLRAYLWMVLMAAVIVGACFAFALVE
jgi:hypothetical protein